MKMFIEIYRQSKGEIEEEQKKKDTSETKKETDYATMDILAEIKKVEEEEKFDAQLYVCQLVAIQDEWRKFKSAKSKPSTSEDKKDDKGEEGDENKLGDELSQGEAESPSKIDKKAEKKGEQSVKQKLISELIGAQFDVDEPEYVEASRIKQALIEKQPNAANKDGDNA